ncbi:MAG: hypothetical protein ACTSSH_07000 [Candidatus Heimdallarchaeota archaeon]
MEVRDVITYNQRIVMKITDKEIAQYFYDKDYGMLLKFLRSGPKTIKEIEGTYLEEGNEKSDKTIYRYIKTLDELGLVVEAGKRIYTDENNKNKTVTLYMRTAKVFLDRAIEMTSEKLKEEKMSRIFKAYKILLDNLEEDKSFTVDCLKDIYDLVYNEGQDYAAQIIEKAGDELFELLEDLDFSGVNDFLLSLSWLIMIYKKDFNKKLDDC